MTLSDLSTITIYYMRSVVLSNYAPHIYTFYLYNYSILLASILQSYFFLKILGSAIMAGKKNGSMTRQSTARPAITATPN